MNHGSGTAVREILSILELRVRACPKAERAAASRLGWVEPVYVMEQMYAELAAQRRSVDNGQVKI